MIPTNMKAAVPTALDDASQKKLAKLRDAKPEDFSSEYDSMQVSAHKDAVSLFERYANGGDDPSLPRVLVLLTRLLVGVLPLLAPDLGRVDLALAGILTLLALSRILLLLAGVLALLASALVALLVLLLFVGILFVCIASFSFAVAAEIGNATQQ